MSVGQTLKPSARIVQMLLEALKRLTDNTVPLRHVGKSPTWIPERFFAFPEQQRQRGDSMNHVLTFEVSKLQQLSIPNFRSVTPIFQSRVCSRRKRPVVMREWDGGGKQWWSRGEEIWGAKIPGLDYDAAPIFWIEIPRPSPPAAIEKAKGMARRCCLLPCYW
ncbi:hypothetical protein BO99DRAFT_402272 [Aspergillus violaceofuscus CBS 115571]|uniref:Uncharacterized protein n=1 Tax=Aspergillus violaceofuscus (strain CBS 115571) TaxID=1450538 RepID=A0A2V5IJS6_ASPV1|nr:hypothetical protein BO99DRAFT_402272 [Aspergillus violaceofuscus CBS 115571]